MKFKKGQVIKETNLGYRLRVLKTHTRSTYQSYDLEIISTGALHETTYGMILRDHECGTWDESCEIDEEYIIDQLLKKYK